MKEKSKTRYESSTFKENFKEQNKFQYKTNDEVRASKIKQSKAKYSSSIKFQEELKSRNKKNYMNEEFKKKKERVQQNEI